MLPPNIQLTDRWHANASNNLWRVIIRKDLPYFTAVLAQEVAEQELKRQPMLLATIAITVATALTALSWGSGIVVAVGLVALACVVGGTHLWQQTPEQKRKLELWGHAVEVAAVEFFYGSVEIDRYLLDEATAIPGWYPQFAGWTPGRVATELRALTPAAEQWVANNLGLLNEWHRRAGSWK